jgi:hypothetical protein
VRGEIPRLGETFAKLTRLSNGTRGSRLYDRVRFGQERSFAAGSKHEQR